MNPNYSRDPSTGAMIPGCSSMDKHAVFVWNQYVKDSGFDRISIVAHSAGGGCLSSIQQTFEDTFYSQVCAIAYTDSWVISKRDLNAE